MDAIETKGRLRTSKLGWGILMGICALLVLNSVGLYIFIAPSHTEQTISILLGGLSLLAFVVAIEGYRFHSRWAWNATWVLVSVLWLVGIHITSVGDPIVGIFYLVLASITLVAQFLAGRGLAPSHRS
jgi:hypothetical protein